MNTKKAVSILEQVRRREERRVRTDDLQSTIDRMETLEAIDEAIKALNTHSTDN